MTSDNGYKNLSPKMKRLLWGAWLYAAVGVLGALVIKDWLGFWPTTIILTIVTAAVLTTLNVLAKRERRKVQGQTKGQTPSL